MPVEPIEQVTDVSWRPYQEPLRVTLARTGTIALVVGAALAAWSRTPALWPVATLLVLWPSLGGHGVELLFLNGLRHRFPGARAAQATARVAVWFAGGVALTLGMRLTAAALSGSALVGPALGGSRPVRWPAWWVGGVAFICVELVAHLVLHLRRRPCFYDGRG